jgi:hypothetical protein
MFSLLWNTPDAELFPQTKRDTIFFLFCFEILYTELFIYLRKTLELPFFYFRFAILGKPPLISNIQRSIEWAI